MLNLIEYEATEYPYVAFEIVGFGFSAENGCTKTGYLIFIEDFSIEEQGKGYDENDMCVETFFNNGCN